MEFSPSGARARSDRFVWDRPWSSSDWMNPPDKVDRRVGLTFQILDVDHGLPTPGPRLEPGRAGKDTDPSMAFLWHNGAAPKRTTRPGASSPSNLWPARCERRAHGGRGARKPARSRSTLSNERTGRKGCSPPPTRGRRVTNALLTPLRRARRLRAWPARSDTGLRPARRTGRRPIRSRSSPVQARTTRRPPR